MRLFQSFVSFLACIALTSCAAAQATQTAAVTERPAQDQASQPFVIAANPLAAEAGLNVLKRGGSAVDAAVAVQAMLSLVEPQSSGMLEGIRQDTMDALRRYFLLNCPAGRLDK